MLAIQSSWQLQALSGEKIKLTNWNSLSWLVNRIEFLPLSPRQPGLSRDTASPQFTVQTLSSQNDAKAEAFVPAMNIQPVRMTPVMSDWGAILRFLEELVRTLTRRRGKCGVQYILRCKLCCFEMMKLTGDSGVASKRNKHYNVHFISLSFLNLELPCSSIFRQPVCLSHDAFAFRRVRAYILCSLAGWLFLDGPRDLGV